MDETKPGNQSRSLTGDSIDLSNRQVFICFDSDVMTKESVNLALAGLSLFLAQQGARVRAVFLPEGDGGRKVGLDDYIAAGNTAADLLACAQEPKEAKPDERPPSKLERQVNTLTELVLVKLLPGANEGTATRLFHTSAGESFAVVAPKEVIQTLPIRSRAFRTYLSAAYYEQYGSAPTREALSQTHDVLEGMAMYDGPEIEVFTRIGVGPDKAIYLDLCDEMWRVIRIDAAGWNVVSQSPIRFRRAQGMLSLPLPKRGGSLKELKPFVNVASDDDFVLLVGWLVGALRTNGPFLVLVLQGEQGSAKSTLTRVLRRLVDPNRAELRAQPRDPRDLAISCQNAWFIALDNLSRVPDWLSDGMCRVATGGGFATRSLYTDSDETIFDSQRPIILNGIDSVATRSDLLDRAILLNLPRLATVRVESVFWRGFEAARPRLLGALLDAVSVALRRENDVEFSASVRMADAARWVVAAEPTLPWDEGRFLEAYSANRADANDLALEASPVGAELQRWIARKRGWSGTAGELLGELETDAQENTKRLKSWPKSARGLSSALRRLAPNLRADGIEIEFLGRTGHDRRRIIRIEHLPALRQDRPHRPHGPHAEEAPSGADPPIYEGSGAAADGIEQRQGEPSADRPHVSPPAGGALGIAADADGSVNTGTGAEESDFDEFLR